MEANPSSLSVRARWALRIAVLLAWVSGVAGTVTSCAVLSHYKGPTPVRVTGGVRQLAPGAAPSVVASGASSAAGTSQPVGPAVSAAPSSAAGSSQPAVSAAPSSAPAGSSAPVRARSSFAVSEAEADIMLEAYERFRRTRLPLTAANFVLSIALVVGAARTLGRRAGGLAWLQQVCFASALFACAEFVGSREERAWLAEAIPAARAGAVEHPGLTREQAEATFRASVRFSFLLKLLGQLTLYGGLAVALGRPSVAAELRADDRSRPSAPPPSSDRDDD
jgi:hypothetical protein